MSPDELLHEAVRLARDNQHENARELFAQIVEQNPDSELAWIWLSGLQPTIDGRLHACRQALRINPQNQPILAHYQKLLDERKIQYIRRVAWAKSRFAEAKSLAAADRRADALAVLEHILQSFEDNDQVWLLLADLTCDLDQRVLALRRALHINPRNTSARIRLRQEEYYRQHPLELVDYYEEQGKFSQAVDVCRWTAKHARSEQEFVAADKKIRRLEGVKQEKITYIPPIVSVARLSAGPPLFYLALMLAQSGWRPYNVADLVYWFGFLVTILGGFLVAVSSIRASGKLWGLISGNSNRVVTPVMRLSLGLLGWVIVLLPCLGLLAESLVRLSTFAPPLFFW